MTVDETKIEVGCREFFDHIWDHSLDEFQTQFDQRGPLDETEIRAVIDVLSAIRDSKSTLEIASAIKDTVVAHVDYDLLGVFLQLAGLTRSKILSDLRASDDVRSDELAKVPSTYNKLPAGQIWNYAGPYLASKLEKVLRPISELDERSAALAIQAINQATYPGFIRQERAKRQGHEAEARLAQLLFECNIPFQPEEKRTNPMCRDATVSGISFDIVIPTVAAPLVCFKATVHTANIGQFGESKDHLEISQAIDTLNRHYPNNRPQVVALIDGVGFSSNSAGLSGIISECDDFCQFRTIWKAAMIAASVLQRTDLMFELEAEELEKLKDFIEKWGMQKFVSSSPAEPRFTRRVSAGDAWILVLPIK